MQIKINKIRRKGKFGVIDRWQRNKETRRLNSSPKYWRANNLVNWQ